MYRLAALAAVVVLSLSTVKAHADTVFDLTTTSNLINTGGLDGTLTLNSASTAFSAIDLTWENETFTSINFQESSSSVDYLVSSTASNGYTLSLYLPVTSLAGYQGGAICGTCVLPNNSGSNHTFIMFNPPGDEVSFNGTLEPAAPAVTPEPSSLTLLATGILGVAGTLRRRLVRF